MGRASPLYVTRQGFNPETQPLTWSSLQLVTKTGRYASSGQYDIPVSMPGRTGRHVVYTIWQASHMDQTYCICGETGPAGQGAHPPAGPVFVPRAAAVGRGVAWCHRAPTRRC